LDVAHSFWNKVKQLADDGKIISATEIFKEKTIEINCIFTTSGK
jgi:hypothetical protein